MIYKNKSSRTGTERSASISNFIEKMGGAGRGGGGKIGLYKPTTPNAKNISGDTQTAFQGGPPASVKGAKLGEGIFSPSRKISYLLGRGFTNLTALAGISAGAKKMLKKHKEEKRQGTILTMP